MDLRLLTAQPTDDERDAIDGVVGDADGRRDLLLPAFQAAQTRAGFVSEGALAHICERLRIPPAEAYGVASFYALLALEPRPRRVLHVCDDIACRCAGATELCAEIEATVGPPGAATQRPEDAIWLRSACLGLCEQAPAGFVTVAGRAPLERSIATLTAKVARAVLAGEAPPPSPARPFVPQAGDPGLHLLARAGATDPASLDDYKAHGGYEALRKAFDMGPDGVVRELLDSKLSGRGGAAFPTGRKWEAVARQPVRPHYLVCNADESEPGTFKDRILMEGDPFAVLEAMTIAAYATGCERGFVYVRGEYPLAFERFSGAVEQARTRRLLGSDVMGRGLVFDVEMRKGAGAYICGEETALFNSIEGFRGEPRNKPPFPAQAGLFGKPTLVNNVETLVNVLPIVLEGGAAFARIGTAESKGPKLFCASGCVARPGVYEVPFGATLRDLISLAGGMRKGRTLRAVLLGGAAGVFVGPDEVDLPLTFEGVRAAKATLGSGVVLVFDDSVDLVPIVLRIAAFFRDESCGQCVPCRVGTVRQEEALQRLAASQPRGSIAEDIALLDEIGRAMKDASICGLGQTAYGAVESAARRLRIFDGRPAR
ncbi:MAG: NAD(P)H-dependent oxidoreductase subunit E [Myxococcales bacterium]